MTAIAAIVFLPVAICTRAGLVLRAVIHLEYGPEIFVSVRQITLITRVYVPGWRVRGSPGIRILLLTEL